MTVCLRQCLENHGLTAYRVAEAARRTQRLNPETVYRVARGESKRLDLGTIEALASLIGHLTGKTVYVTDLFQLQPV